MNTIQSKILGLLAIALATSACNPNISDDVNEEQNFSRGDADFSVFVTIGDSLSAGYADSALYRDGQQSSMPKILAEQFASVGGGNFTQPLMPVGATGSLSITGIGTIPGPMDRLVLAPTGDPDNPLGPDTIIPTQTTAIDTRVGNGGFNNLATPSAKIYHTGIPGYGELSVGAFVGGTANPFFARFSSSDTASILGDAVAQSPTFFLYWMGSNDLFLYASDGGTGVDQTGNSNVLSYTPGENDITDPGFLTSGGTGAATGIPGFTAQIAALTAGGAKGVIATVPRIDSIPFFTRVPFNAIPLEQADADAANAGFAPYNAGVNLFIGTTCPGASGPLSAEEAAARQITFEAGQNAIVILDEELTDLTSCPGTGGALTNMRQATAEDFILLTTAPKLGTDAGGGLVFGVSAPLDDGDILTKDEAEAVETARQAYNVVIEATANGSDDLLLFDATAVLARLNEEGINYGTGAVSAEFATGGFFSLDGIHPTQRGNAIVANLIIDVINEGFNANLPKANPGDYATVFYQ